MSLPTDPPAPSASPARRRRGLWLGLGIAVLALGLLCGASAVLAGPRLCAVTEPQSHGLACDIPLPPNATFDERGQTSSGQITVGQITMVAEAPFGTPPAQGTVVGAPVGAPTVIASQILPFRASTTTPEGLRTFYAQQLPAKGWTCVGADDPIFVFGMQGNRAVNVAIPPLPQAGADTLFVVEVVTFSEPLDTSTC